MQDVADVLGISRATVSLALRDSPTVAAPSRGRVRATAEGLGYVYNRGAANLRQSKSNLIGLIVPALTNPFVAEFASGVQDVVQAQGHVNLVINTREDIDQQRSVINAMAEQRASGAVIIPVLGTLATDFAPLLANRTQTVVVNRSVPDLMLPFVRPDEERLVELAGKHLMDDHGAQTIAYFGGLADAGPRRSRLQRLIQLVASRDVQLDTPWTTASASDPQGAYDVAMGLLLQTSAVPEAIICHSDELAWGLLRALQEESRPLAAPPRVISIDGLDISAFVSPGLTTVKVEANNEGRRCGTLILRSLGLDLEVPSEIAPELVVRRSCGCR